MTSIIIPAHNEEKTIEKCLRPLVDAVQNNELEVIVVCNGCTDRTASKVAKLSDSLICVETDKASKTNALNIGDQIASSFPRFYLDADVCLSTKAITGIAKILERTYLAASPEVKMNLNGSSWIVKAYYEVWFLLPYCRAGMIGAGVYALSKKGRERFGQFPELISDDGYVRCLFSEFERGVAGGSYSVVTAPKNVAGLIKIKTRSRLGVYELKKKYPNIIGNEEKDYRGATKKLIWDVKLWPKIFIYLIIIIVTRLRALRQMKTKVFVWERDETSR